MSLKKTYKRLDLFAGMLCMALLLTGCAATISALHNGPIKQSPGSVPFGTRVNDTTLETIAEVNISKASPTLKESHIVSTVFNGAMLLVGQVSSEKDKKLVTSVAQEIRGVKKVYNELEIKPNTTWLARVSDAWLTTKIKTRMMITSDLPSSHIKIVTEQGVVYLMGKVRDETAQKAINIVKGIDGVQKVVTLFDFL